MFSRNKSKVVRNRIALIAAMLCTAMALPVLAASPRYTMPVWSMGNFNPYDKTNITMIASTPRLAFKGMTLAEMKAKIDDGYDVFAVMCGQSMGGARGKIASLYNVQAYPSDGTITKLFGDFCVFDNPYAKAVCVEFTDGENGDGVYVKGLKPLYKQQGDVATKFMNIKDDGAVEYVNYTKLYDLSTGWSIGNYGAGNIQMAKYIPEDTSILVWEGTTLDEIKDYEITGSFGGICSRWAYPCSAYNKRVSYSDEGIATNMVAEMQAIDAPYIKCVVVNFTNGDGGVHAQALTALHVSGTTPGLDFSNGDGTYPESPDSVVANYAGEGYGVYGLVAQKKAIYSASNEIIESTPILVFPNATIDDIKDGFLGCHFTGNSINKKGIEGRGCNKRITYDENGTATKIRVEFQTRDGGKAGQMYVKCAVVDLTNGNGGVYATHVGAGYKAESNPVGVNFVAEDGSYSGGSNYRVYDLSVAPCISLDGDEDWSPFGRQLLGDAVIDLNGHTLTAGELMFDTSRTGMVVNTAYTSLSQLRFFSFEGGSVSNWTANIGNYCLGTANIKVVAEGSGIYYPAKSVEYAGGTQIAGGIAKSAKSPANTDAFYLFGATSSTVIIDSGAALDWNDTWNHYQYEFILNGGELKHTGALDFDLQYALLKKITLTKDSTFTNERKWGLINRSYAEVTLDLAGHTLDIITSDSKQIYFVNVKMSAGAINASGDGALEIANQSIGLSAPNTDFNVACELRIYKPMSVHDYTAAATKNGANLGTAALNVHGTFKPVTAYFRGVTMQDGSTIDLSAWPAAAGWPVASAYTCEGDKEIKFAEASGESFTTVTVKLGNSKVTGGKILSWADGSDVSRVKFLKGDSDRRYSLVKKADGLYAECGFTFVIR